MKVRFRLFRSLREVRWSVSKVLRKKKETVFRCPFTRGWGLAVLVGSPA
jgi:hypothetical protein